MVLKHSIALLYAAGLTFAACSSSSPSPPASPSSQSTGTKTGTKTSTCASLFLTKDPTYDDDVKDVIDKSCASSSCHGDGGQDPILTDYDQVKKASDRVAGSISEQSMPPRDTLDQADSDLIAKWADQGFREKAGDKIKTSGTGSTTESGEGAKAEESCD